MTVLRQFLVPKNLSWNKHFNEGSAEGKLKICIVNRSSETKQYHLLAILEPPHWNVRSSTYSDPLVKLFSCIFYATKNMNVDFEIYSFTEESLRILFIDLEVFI